MIPRNNPIILNVDHRLAELNRFMDKHKCPRKFNKDYLTAADKYTFASRVLPVISIKESGSKHCTDYPIDSNNPFGWGSGRIKFDSVPHAIDYITGQLANGHYYAGKTIKGKLGTYNSENPAYVPDALRMIESMKNIKPHQIKI